MGIVESATMGSPSIFGTTAAEIRIFTDEWQILQMARLPGLSWRKTPQHRPAALTAAFKPAFLSFASANLSALRAFRSALATRRLARWSSRFFILRW